MNSRRRQFLISSLAAAAATTPAASRAGAHTAVRRLIIPRVSNRSDLTHNYPAQLLEQALAASGYAATLESTTEQIPQNRALQELGHRSGRLDVFWTMTSAERERQALPVRVPIFKGLYGWRLLLATAERAERLREMKSLDDLRKFTMVQGLEWPDTGILQANGVPVTVSANYDAMFKQLRLGRADGFPRSVEEAWWELERYGQGLVVVPDVCVHYPAAMYFFVAPTDWELAVAIEQGLTRMRASGAFDRLFLRHHGDDLARAKLGSRHIIELRNPTLSSLTPLDKPELWYKP